MYRLKQNEVVHTLPTIGFTMETISFGDLEFCVWDLGGQDKIRPLWRHYFTGANGLIFVVDSADKGSFNVAKSEFHQIIHAHELKGVPILVLANKQDLETAVSPQELSQFLELNLLDPNKCHIEGTCALTGKGLVEGITWLSDAVTGKIKPKKV